MSLLSHNLQAFVAVTKQGSVHAAAKVLGLTQTGVTQRIRVLEEQVGSTLFIRSRKGMRLTAEGQALFRYCQAATDLEGETLARISGAGTQAEVRVTILGPSSILRSRIIPACLPVMKKFPRVVATFEINDVERGDEALRAGKASLAILPPEHVAKEMDSKRLRPERYVLVAARKWRKRTVQDVVTNERIIDFDPSDRMTHSYLKKFGLLTLPQTERHFVNNTESLVDLFEAGAGYGVLAEEFARPHLSAGRISLLNGGRAYESPIAAAWYPRSRMPEYFAALVRALT